MAARGATRPASSPAQRPSLASREQPEAWRCRSSTRPGLYHPCEERRTLALTATRWPHPRMVPVAGPIRIVRVITRLNIGGPAIHAILLSKALDDGGGFSSTLGTGTTAPHEGIMLDSARAHAVEPVVLPALGREISPLDD